MKASGSSKAGKLAKKNLRREDHEALAVWAADCAEHVLPYFEKEYPEDDRPRKAIKACRRWARTGVFRMADVRRDSLAAHAAAREAKEDSAARYAARAAGQAVATAHAPRHAIGPAWYGIKAAEAAGVADEREWQHSHLPKRLHPMVSAEATRHGRKNPGRKRYRHLSIASKDMQ
ncbi:MAG: hypothetical protein V1921_04025 [Candidatus Altiarchaeota archaeon]